MIINSNIKKVVYATPYPDTDSLKFFRDAGVEVEYRLFELKKPDLDDKNSSDKN
jgi:dCMP deaminase